MRGVKYCILLLISGILPCVYAQSLKIFEQEFIKIVRQVRSSVVRVRISYKHRCERASSGIILDSNGHIVTVASAVRDYDTIYIQFHSNKKVKAKLLGIDCSTNLALLKIATSKIRAVKKGASEQLQVGAFLITIGNPYGLNNSVSTGIVSGLNRCVWLKGCSRPLTGLIQTTAPINPGDDGGLVVDSHGRFVGMAFSTIKRDLLLGTKQKLYLTFIQILQQFRQKRIAGKNLNDKLNKLCQQLPPSILQKNSWATSSGNILTSQGINFVLSSKTIYWVAEQIIKYGKVRRGWVGIKVKDCEYQQGVLVTAVVKNGPAAQSGIAIGDCLIAINGRKIINSHFLLHQISHMVARQKIILKLLRKKTTHTISFHLAQYK